MGREIIYTGYVMCFIGYALFYRNVYIWFEFLLFIIVMHFLIIIVNEEEIKEVTEQ